MAIETIIADNWIVNTKNDPQKWSILDDERNERAEIRGWLQLV